MEYIIFLTLAGKYKIGPVKGEEASSPHIYIFTQHVMKMRNKPVSGCTVGGARLAAGEASMDRVGGGRGIRCRQHGRWRLETWVCRESLDFSL